MIHLRFGCVGAKELHLLGLDHNGLERATLLVG